MSGMNGVFDSYFPRTLEVWNQSRDISLPYSILLLFRIVVFFLSLFLSRFCFICILSDSFSSFVLSLSLMCLNRRSVYNWLFFSRSIANEWALTEWDSNVAACVVPFIFCLVFFIPAFNRAHHSLYSGRESSERAIPVARRKEREREREREEKTLSLVVRLLSVGPESLNVFFFTDRGRRRLLLVVSPFLKKRKPYFFYFCFSIAKKK